VNWRLFVIPEEVLPVLNETAGAFRQTTSGPTGVGSKPKCLLVCPSRRLAVPWFSLQARIKTARRLVARVHERDDLFKSVSL
jgi:hypothetical protein